MKISVRVKSYHIIIALGVVKVSQTRPVSSPNDFRPITDVNWSDLGNIINIDELDYDKDAFHQVTLQNSSQSHVHDPIIDEKQKKELSKKGKAKIYKQRHKIKLASDPKRKEEALKKSRESSNKYRKPRKETMSEEKKEELKERRRNQYKPKSFGGFSSPRILEWHNLKTLETTGKANEADLARLNELRRKDRINKKNQYQRKIQEGKLPPRYRTKSLKTM